MNPAARVQTAIELVDAIISGAREGGAAADVIATRFFKERRYAGSGDRRAIRDLAWRVVRRFGEIPKSGRSAMVAMADGDDELAALFNGEGRGPTRIGSQEHRAVGGVMPQWLVPALNTLIDDNELSALLDRAPLDLRINRSRLGSLALPVGEPLPPPLDGLRLPSDTAVLDSEAYLSGAIEVQDAGSQWIAHLCAATADTHVIDLCAGAGGKTLALSNAMGAQGRLVACDTDRGRLQQLPARARRAGAEHIETRLLDPNREAEALADLLGTADIVLVDAPCSGSGTWRRNPESRWRMSPIRLARLVDAQAYILDLAAQLVAPGGAIVYAVCSIITAEGEQQVDDFLKRHPNFKAQDLSSGIAHEGTFGRQAGSGRLLTPLHDATDGFFVARLLCR